MKNNKKASLKELLELYFLFVKIGCITFGGGMGMLPIINNELIEKRAWIDEDEVAEYFAIGLCTPGVQAINISTFVGEKRAGSIGGILSTLGFVTAPIICILLIAGIITKLSLNPTYQAALRAIRAFVCDNC